ncbi:hypothetical protein KIW84_035706 [Lathyrus oleraceus]|uniref:Uncharacterized protein n=1 Tax=Pisum sativum TaxID=3888 RepID=A0A9D4Y4C8_PEA|nr:hypothetical protein KIW84_035699 [Pisum sativum]KAI5431638.1 hypothetical protein KIW84_035703 [Pisum sativum]KAI5431646.1 hypothetical protein KIW84_035706 [Pisum sativum]
MLRGGGVMTNVYELCDVDLKDFSIQGCLLRSLPGDVIFDNSSGVSFTCDLSDNIAAPWPSSSSFTSLSFCAPEMSLPALPISQSLKNIDYLNTTSSWSGYALNFFPEDYWFTVVLATYDANYY